MRKIKLRGCDSKTKEFLGVGDMYYWGGYAMGGDGLTEIDFVLYTGLKDKNGKGNEVYCSDIFEAIYKDCPDGFSIMGKETTVIKVNCEVVFRWGKFMIKIMHPDLKEFVYTDLYDFLKNPEKVVIGNIHQNPELLK